MDFRRHRDVIIRRPAGRRHSTSKQQKVICDQAIANKSNLPFSSKPMVLNSYIHNLHTNLSFSLSHESKEFLCIKFEKPANFVLNDFSFPIKSRRAFYIRNSITLHVCRALDIQMSSNYSIRPKLMRFKFKSLSFLNGWASASVARPPAIPFKATKGSPKSTHDT